MEQKIILPDEIFGKKVEGAIERVLSSPQPVQDPQPNIITPATNLADLENYIILQRKVHNFYEYPDMLVSMHRLGFNSDVEKAAKQLGSTLKDTAKEYEGKGPGYIGSIKWEQALKLNLLLGGETLSPRQFIDFKELLESGKAFDGKGVKVPNSRLVQILNEIRTVRDPYRAEWLDADFKVLDKKENIVSDPKKGRLYLLSRHIIQAGVLDPQYKADIEGKYLDSNSQIDEKSFNEYGLPTKKGNGFNYWSPPKDNNSVAWFYAYSVRAGLICYGLPDDSYSGLGVRHARKKS